MTDSTGTALMDHICMCNAHFTDGHPQPLYYPSNHPTHPSIFKGMAVLLEERGYHNARTLCAKCKGFKCAKNDTGEYVGNCCCCCILFELPDFKNVPSLLTSLCDLYGVQALFLPKFSPELNPIEQCWGFAKQTYREFLPSSTIKDLIRNMHEALASVPLVSIHKYMYSTYCLTLTHYFHLDLPIVHSVMKIATRRVSMAVKWHGQHTDTRATEGFHQMPQKR